MSYSRRQLYAMGEALGECVTRKEGGRIIYGGGGGGGQPAPAPTSNVTTTSNIPEYARPYVETMLGATQQQLFNTAQGPGGTTQITGVKPYQAFGGATYAKDEKGNFITNPDGSYQYAAGPAAGMGPGEMSAARAAYAPMDPLQQRAYADISRQGVTPQLAGGRDITNISAANAANAGALYNQQATNPYATQAFMSPYMQNVVDVQQREARRMSDIAGAQQRGQAAQQGAYGGSRQALMEAERQRNLATQQGQIQAQGLQNAFQNAQQAQQFGSTLGLQGAQAGLAGGQQMYNQALGILGQQQAAGAQQQAYNQNILNQAIQNYAMQQQYPQQQLAFMNAQLRGLPMQSSTTQSYQAPPSYLSQAAGLGMGAYGLSKLAGKKGGLPKDFEKKKDDAPGGLQALALSKM
jgi:hypothetical protein